MEVQAALKLVSRVQVTKDNKSGNKVDAKVKQHQMRELDTRVKRNWKLEFKRFFVVTNLFFFLKRKLCCRFFVQSAGVGFTGHVPIYFLRDKKYMSCKIWQCLHELQEQLRQTRGVHTIAHHSCHRQYTT